jgi:AcrR family transcriptional regulator
MARRADHSREDLKALIISTAHQMLEDEGLPALSARKIMAKIGYTSGTLYQVVADFNALLLHVNAHTLQGLHQHLVAELPKQSKGMMRLKQMAAFYAGYVQAHPNAFAALMAYQWPNDAPVPAWYQEHVDALFLLVEQSIKDYKADANAPRHARLLWAGLNGLCLMANGGKVKVLGKDTFAQLAENFTHTYLEGITY